MTGMQPVLPPEPLMRAFTRKVVLEGLVDCFSRIMYNVPCTMEDARAGRHLQVRM